MTNIMYLADTYEHPYAGTEKQLYALITGLDKTKYNITITLLRGSRYIKENDFPCPVDILDIKKLLSVTSIFKIINFAWTLKTNNYKLVHIFFNDASIIAPIILRIFGLKVIISRRDMGFWYTKVNLALLRINRYFINAVITNSEAVKLITHQKEIIPLKKIHVIYNGNVINNLSTHADEKINEIAVLNSASKIIGIVANIRPIKRIDHLIKAFRQVKSRLKNTALVIVGAGPKETLAKLVDDLKLNDSVYFLGGQSNALSIIKHFDVAVLCSETEGLSNAIIEYIHCQVLVVCTDVGGNSELIEDGITGYLVPAGDIDQLANNIYKALTINEIEKITMTKNAYKHISDLCDIDKMISRHSVIYNSL